MVKLKSDVGMLVNPVALTTPTTRSFLKRNSVTDYNHSVGFVPAPMKRVGSKRDVSCL